MDLTVLEAFGLGGLLWFPFPGLTRLNLGCQLAWALTGGMGEESASRISQFVGTIQFILVVLWFPFPCRLLLGASWLLKTTCIPCHVPASSFKPSKGQSSPSYASLFPIPHLFLSWRNFSAFRAHGIRLGSPGKSKLIYFKVFNFNHICKASFAM